MVPLQHMQIFAQLFPLANKTLQKEECAQYIKKLQFLLL